MTTEAQKEADRLLQAADWQMQVESGKADRCAFDAWLDDPLNAAAWARLNGVLCLIDDHANDQKMVGFRHAALEDAQRSGAFLNRPPPRRRMRIAAVLLLAVLGGAGYYWATAPDAYRTAFNERRVVRLADGSKIALDSDSEVTVRYTKTGREIRLARGQARFDVAHDVSRPFSVRARGQKVIATGTVFNVDITQPKVLVTLIEGRVIVFDESGAQSFISPFVQPPPVDHKSVNLRAGQQLAAIPDRIAVVSPADMRGVLAWTNGQLIFDDAPLSEVVARVSHYTTRPIVVADARTARLRISGSFNTGDIDGFLDIVTHYLPVEQTTDADGNIALHEK